MPLSYSEKYPKRDPSIKCIYSIGVAFALHGMGTTAHYAVGGLYKAGMLKKLLCASHKKTEIPEDLIQDVVFKGRITLSLLRRGAVLLGSANGYGIRSIVYDNCACRYIRNCDIFHGWALESVKSLTVAKQQGAKFTILERSSSHILKQKSILEEEYKKRNLTKPPIDAIEVERNIMGYEKADYVIVPSDFAYKSFIDYGFDVKKLVKIPYGYDPQLFKPTPRKDDIFRVLFCGNISLQKGIAYLLEAWDKLNFKNAELIFIGHIFNETKHILKKYISKNSTIKIKKFVPYNNIAEHYQQADVFVLPSLQEGSALVNYEAMACGLPVITTFNSGSVVRNGIDGFIIKPQNTKELYDKLQYMYDNKEKRQQMGINASEYIKNYTWEKYNEKLCNFYSSLLKT